MVLKAVMQTALERLGALAGQPPAIRLVSLDPPDTVNTLPQLVFFEGGVSEIRAQGWQEFAWDVPIAVYVKIGKLEIGAKECREIMADLVDSFRGDLKAGGTLGGAVQRHQWASPITVVSLARGDVEYVGVRGTYRLYLQDGAA
ncbi:MAG: hypothetical protein GEU73_06080 [Chloroflexi bacterium]|nr:hypothetical protein [Chloroflexota bacterium]